MVRRAVGWVSGNMRKQHALWEEVVMLWRVLSAEAVATWERRWRCVRVHEISWSSGRWDDGSVGVVGAMMYSVRSLLQDWALVLVTALGEDVRCRARECRLMKGVRRLHQIAAWVSKEYCDVRRLVCRRTCIGMHSCITSEFQVASQIWSFIKKTTYLDVA